MILPIGIITFKKRNAELIFSKRKTVEIRRTPSVFGKNRWWLVYVPEPVKGFIGYVYVKSIERLSPSSAYKKYGDDMCPSESEFWDYTKNYPLVTVFKIKEILKLKGILPLKNVTDKDPDFVPPEDKSYFKNNMRR